jgi:hypothetical protein
MAVTAYTAKPATSKIPRKTSPGLPQKAVAGHNTK